MREATETCVSQDEEILKFVCLGATVISEKLSLFILCCNINKRKYCFNIQYTAKSYGNSQAV